MGCGLRRPAKGDGRDTAADAHGDDPEAADASVAPKQKSGRGGKKKRRRLVEDACSTYGSGCAVRSFAMPSHGCLDGSSDQRWWSEWEARVERWWLATPHQRSIHGCFGSLAIGLARRLENLMNRFRSGLQLDDASIRTSFDDGAATESCEMVQSEAEAGGLNLPDFPDMSQFDMSRFELPPVLPIPRRIPEWEWLQSSRPIDATARAIAHLLSELPATDAAAAVALTRGGGDDASGGGRVRGGGSVSTLRRDGAQMALGGALGGVAAALVVAATILKRPRCLIGI